MRDADRLLAGLIRRTGGWTSLLTLAALATAAAELALPILLGRALDGVLAGQAAAFAACALAVAVAAAGEVCADLAAGVSRVAATADLRHRLIRHLLAAGPALPRRFGTGELAARLTGNAEEAGHAPPAVVLAVTSLVPAAGSLVLLFLIDLRLGFTFLAGALLTLLLLRSFVRDASAVVAAYQRAQGDIARLLLDALAGARTIAAAGTRRAEAGRILRGLPELRRHGAAMWRVQADVAVKTAVLGPLTQIAVLGVAGFALSAGDITTGDLLAASRYAVLGTGFGAAASFLNRLARARAAAGRAAEVLACPPVAYGARSLPPGGGRLEFRGVAAAGVLHGVDLVVPGGQAVALVGRSGSGKSLLAALAGRMADPEAGEVSLDGVPLRELSRSALRAAVGYAFARPALLGRTLHDLIALGGATPQAVREAARAARADDFIRRLPQGYGTAPGEAPLSGGEAQRLGLARAFAHRGRLLILDDATSSLDTVTELHVSRAIAARRGGRTCLIVAHRAATAARADLVAWLDDGRIRAVGRHDELWRDPAYREIFQAGPDPAAATPPGAPHGALLPVPEPS